MVSIAEPRADGARSAPLLLSTVDISPAGSKALRDKLVRAFESVAEVAAGGPEVFGLWKNRAARVGGCGEGLPVAVRCRSKSCGHTWSFVPSCGLKVCPRCSRAGAGHRQEVLTHAIAHMADPRALTLTLRNRPRGQLLAMRLEVDRMWRRLREHSEWRKHKVTSAVAVFETKLSTAGEWHVHVHVVYDGLFWRQRQLGHLWQGLARSRADVNPATVWVERVRSRGGMAGYLAKYLTKAAKLDALAADDLAEFVHAWSGFKELRTYGDARKRASALQTAAGWVLTCPECGGPGDALGGIAATLAFSEGSARSPPDAAGGAHLSPEGAMIQKAWAIAGGPPGCVWAHEKPSWGRVSPDVRSRYEQAIAGLRGSRGSGG